MKHRFHFNRIVWITCLTILVLLTAYSFANAKDWGDKPVSQGEKAENEESRGVPVPGGPGFISIPASAFIAYLPDSQWSYVFYDLYNPSTTDVLVSRAPVYLPHGSMVNQVVLYFYDNYGADDLEAQLSRIPLLSSTADDLSIINSSALIGGFGYKTDTTIAYATIDNQNYAYFVQLIFPKNGLLDIRFSGLRIDYEYPGYLPCVTK